jgi:hypothetical protein
MDEHTVNELDSVALMVDLPDENLVRGQVGTVVFVYAADAFEVEFVDPNGCTYGLATLKASQLLPLRFEPIVA